LKSGLKRLGAIIVAAGTSQRMGGTNKLWAPLKGRPLLAWSVETCQMCSAVQQIVLVLNECDLPRGARLKERRGWAKVVLCAGGLRRQDSVKAGLRHISNCELVMIHDGARPFLTPGLISAGLHAVEETGAAVAAVTVKDTVKLADHGGLIAETIARDRLWVAQTPQVFRSDIIARAYEALAVEATDDAAAVELIGHRVLLFAGDSRNIKVTTIEDLALARILAGGARTPA
jgi:2-C-methyl-D-erythritol 4-phosphate cytidylyltransferase